MYLPRLVKQILSKWVSEKRSTYYYNLNGHLMGEWGTTTSAGANVNSESALTHATVFACVKVLAESAASLPVSLYRRLPDGGSEIAFNRPEHRLISTYPSERYTGYTFRETMQIILGLRGNAYARIYRDGRGTARELVILHPDSVRPFFYQNKLYYEVYPNADFGYEQPNGREVLRPYDILHIRSFSTNGILGRSPITLLRENIGIGLTARDFAAKSMKDGHLRGIVKSEHKLTPDQVKSTRDNFVNALQQGRFPVLENNLQFQTIALTPADSEFISTAKLNRQDIAGAYRVPAHMIGDLERSTNNNIEHQSLEFSKYTLLPWVTNWEQELDRKLVPIPLQGEYFYNFNMDELQRGDFSNRVIGFTRMVQWGIMNRDEVRQRENLNPIPDGLGQTFITPLNMVPIEDQQQGDGEPNSDTTNTQQNGTTTN